MSTTTEHKQGHGACHKGGSGHHDFSCWNQHHRLVHEWVCETAWGQKTLLYLPANGPDQCCCYGATAIHVNYTIISNGLCSKKGNPYEPEETLLLIRVAV